jgi:hypothetical protein
LAEPRSSSLPHFDGHRWFSAGGDQLGACARAAFANSAVAMTAPAPIHRIDVSSNDPGRSPGWRLSMRSACRDDKLPLQKVAPSFWA